MPRNKRVVSTGLLLLHLLAGLALAQRIDPVRPTVYRKPPGQRTVSSAPPGERFHLPRPQSVRLPRLDSGDLDKVSVKTGAGELGVHRSLEETTLPVAGAWIVSPDGSRVWRLALSSEGAVAVRVHFTGFSVGEGRVWVGDKSYTGLGPWGTGDFWSPVVFSDTAVVEYEPASPDAAVDSVPFTILEISHLWSAPAEPVEAALTPLAQAGSCQLDVSCYPEWAGTAPSVALIVFESQGATYECSGTLLNTRDNSFTPYFLTAAHCVESNSVAHTVEAFWLYQSSTCNGPAPDINRASSVLGATQVRRYGDFNDPRGDFNLLLLADVPDGVVFSGWDPNPTSTGVSVAGIHHPEGEYTRITFGTTVGFDPYGASDAYLIVRETDGRTESGSSGSGLFTEPNLLVGSLSFGPVIERSTTACQVNPYYSGYARFSALYPEVSDYLEEIVPPPVDAGAVLTSGTPRDFSLQAVYVPTLFTNSIYQIVVPSDATKLTVDLATTTQFADIDLYVRYGQAPEVQGGEVIADYRSTSPTGTEQVVVDTSSVPALQAGTYYIGFVVWTRGVNVDAQVTATVETAPVGPPEIGAVVHGATQVAGAVAPGEIVTIYGSNVGPADGVEAILTGAGRLPTTVQETQVLFNGVPAPLFFVRHDQVNLQVPYEVRGSGSASVQVVYRGAPSSTVTVPVAGSAPGIFMFLDGSGRAVVVNQDNSINSAANPESRGRVVTIYATGQGVTIPASTTGVPAPGQLPLPTPNCR